jgi:hypothetical protein
LLRIEIRLAKAGIHKKTVGVTDAGRRDEQREANQLFAIHNSPCSLIRTDLSLCIGGLAHLNNAGH